MSAKDMFYKENQQFTKAKKRAFARQELVYNVTEDILVALEDMGITKKELAGRLGKSPSFVTQILSGVRNMTLGSLSDICFALGVKPIVSVNSPPILESLNTRRENVVPEKKTSPKASGPSLKSLAVHHRMTGTRGSGHPVSKKFPIHPLGK